MLFYAKLLSFIDRGNMALKIYVYSKCSTCQKAIRFLEQHGIAFEQKEITVTTPSLKELHQMLGYMGNEVTKLFNSSGMLYRDMQLSAKLKALTPENALKLLTAHGMLVKRPFLIGEQFGLVGFRENQWTAHLKAMVPSQK